MQPFPGPLFGSSLANTWDAAWSALGRRAPASLRQELQQAWTEPQRHYHDLRHLGECLALWSRWGSQFERRAEVALALWFHDAIYDPQRADNERESAAWAARSLSAAGAADDVVQRIHGLVMATRHGEPTVGADAQVLLDIDLAILGSPPDRFEAYDQDIRKEYAWVPSHLYITKRAAVLRGFAERPQLYHCAPAVDLLEERARSNLIAAISRLSQ